VQVSEYDHQSDIMTTTVINTTRADDHNNPALLMLPSNNKLLALYARHHRVPYYQSISTNPADASEWEAVESLGATMELNTYTYANPVYLSDENKIYNFFRGPSSAFGPYFSTTSNEGQSWEAATHFIANGRQRPYLKLEHNGNNRIDFCLTDAHPYYVESNSIYHLYYQGGNFFKTDGALVGAMADLPIAPTDATLVYDGSEILAWNHDIAIDANGHPVIVYATFPERTNHRYRYARWTGSEWLDYEICIAGTYLYAAEWGYSGGVCLDHQNPNIVYASREIGDGVHRLYKYITGDNGETWEISQLTEGFAIRPFIVRWHRGGKHLLYLTGSYSTYQNYNTQFVFVDPS